MATARPHRLPERLRAWPSWPVHFALKRGGQQQNEAGNKKVDTVKAGQDTKTFLVTGTARQLQTFQRACDAPVPSTTTPTMATQGATTPTTTSAPSNATPAQLLAAFREAFLMESVSAASDWSALEQRMRVASVQVQLLARQTRNDAAVGKQPISAPAVHDLPGPNNQVDDDVPSQTNHHEHQSEADRQSSQELSVSVEAAAAEDPRYSQYRRLLRIGALPAELEQRMRAEGLDPSVVLS